MKIEKHILIKTEELSLLVNTALENYYPPIVKYIDSHSEVEIKDNYYLIYKLKLKNPMETKEANDLLNKLSNYTKIDFYTQSKLTREKLYEDEPIIFGDKVILKLLSNEIIQELTSCRCEGDEVSFRVETDKLGELNY